MARSALQPAILIRQFRVLPGKLSRGGLDGPAIVRDRIRQIQTQDLRFLFDRSGEIPADALQLLGVDL